MKLRTLIADDHQLVVEGLVRLIEDECEIIGIVNNGRDLISSVRALNPDIILLDVSMPLLNGVEAARQIRQFDKNVKIIFVTMQMNGDYAREAFHIGANAYVLKQSAVSELMSAIQNVQSGRYFLSPTIADRFLENLPEPGENPSRLFTNLTPRQREVLQLVAEGKSAKEIAALLNISSKTVEFHKKHLMDDLDLGSTAELIRYAVEHSWVSS